MRPKLLDLYGKAGGAAMGYHRAGFDVVGVDIEPQPDYPFEFQRADALEFLVEHGHEFDAVHASPPCRDHTALTSRVGTNGTGWLLAATRDILIRLPQLSVIENVQGAPMRRDLTLCGEMFGLGVIRHRWFELGGWSMGQPEHKPHRGRVSGMRHGQWFDGPYFQVYGDGGGKGSVADWQRAMGIDWMTRREDLANAVPPAYTELIGEHMMRELRQR
jgi:site-specific DNA-cytosine methylase